LIARRHRLYLVITLLAPVLLFGLAELALRATGTGALEPLFVPVEQAPGYLQPNPQVIQRFFPDPRQAPEVSVDTTWFPAAKAPGTLRIFVQGASSAAGFPYGRWASPAALLQQRLQRAYPDREIEIINTAMAAVTSYALLDFADEIIEQQPDAVVIYAGHNEYLGIGGVGSSLVSARSPTLARAVARLRRLHLYHGFERLVGRLAPAPGPLADRGGTLMARVAAERSIPLGSPLYEQGVEQFHGNLSRLVETYSEAGVPVFIGTLASNERDQPPFADTPPAGGGAAAAETFARARELDRQRDHAAAREAYRAARDLDGLRFRAPSEFNNVIRSVAERSGATVVDVEAALAAASSHGIVGEELMLEHVHPNVAGYFELASAFYAPLVDWLGRPPVSVDDDTARAEIPVTEVDRLHGEYRLAMLKNDWPFVPERRPTELPAAGNDIEEIAQQWFLGRATWAEAMNRALAAYQQAGDFEEGARVAVNLAEAFVNADDVQHLAGRLLLRAGQPERALRYLQRALRLNEQPVEYWLNVAQAQYGLGRRDESIATLERVLAEHPGEERASYWLEVIRREAGQ
jgi:tetratricopeptide (TPR) repeat protein